MFNNNLPVSSLFCKISLLCLPHCLPARIHCTFCSSAFCALCTIPIQCTFCLLSISAAALHLLLHTCITHQQQQPPSLLFSTFLYSLCILCILCMQWFCILCMSSALPLHHGNSSASLFVKPICPSSLGVMIKFLHITGS
jgi:hypothetical protein